MKKTPYPHQEKATQATFKWFETNTGNPLVVVPVGGGKSLLMAEFIGRAQEMYPGTRFMVATHVKELLVQNSAELMGQYPNSNISFWCAGLGKKSFMGDVIFASVQSVAKNVFGLPKPIDILIVDECHLISHKEDTSYQLLIKNLKILNPKLKVIGYTGTAFRPNGQRLDDGDGKIFDGVTYEIPMQYLIDKGFLCPLVTPSVSTKMSVTGVGTRNGDYIESQLQAAVDKDEITKACVDEIIQYGQDRKKWLVFTSGVKHCEHVRDEIRSRGISCEMVHGEMDKHERDRIIARYKTDEVRCMVNVAVLTTGFNHPPIDMLAFCRPTRSPVLYVQTSGRGMRTAPDKKDCLVLDFGGVIETLGPVDTIDARMRAKGNTDGTGDAPTKVCPVCSAVMFAGVRECPDCLYVFPDNKTDLYKKAVKDAAILASQERPQEYEVLSIDYAKHDKKDKPSSMSVRYTTIGGSFKEWICFEHGGYAGEKARAWHYKRMPNTKAPTSVDEALNLTYPPATYISVKRGIKYSEIVGHRFDYIKKEAEPIQISQEAENLLSADDIPF